MPPLDDLSSYWNERLRRDLSPFADPGTTLDLLQDRYSFIARWMARNRQLEARFNLSLDAGIRVSFRGDSLSYRSFLATEALADLRGLAKMMLQAQRTQLYIPTKARRTDAELHKSEPAVDLLHLLLSDADDSGLTRILFVTGDAGAGKTRTLLELVHQQATRYLHGSADRLYLYVNAQGRALARFHEALATELQDLRASVTYHAVSTLVRAGILVPVIDGFDELLGVGGYDDAFSSLAAFIEELEGLGQLVASARSTYYEQEFVTRADSVSSLGAQAWTLVPIEVLAWGDEEFNRYVQAISKDQYASQSFIQHVRDAFSGNNADLKQKPLFVARTVDLVLEGHRLTGDRDLLSDLVTTYLDRERTQKLLDRNNSPILTVDQLTDLMTAVAEEMWNSETRELDSRFLRDIAALVLDPSAASSAEVVVQRMPSLALLSRGETRGGVAFEHELFFAFFLARVFVTRLQGDTAPLRLLLGRSILPPDVARLTVASLLDTDPELAQLGLDELLEKVGGAALQEGPRASQVRENAGLLTAMGLIRTAQQIQQLSGKRIRSVVFPGGDLAGVTLHDTILDNVEFRRVDLTRTRFLQSRSIASSFVDVVVDPTYTRLELAGLDVRSHIQGLRRKAQGLTERIYDPVDLHRTLATCGAVEPPREETSTVRVVDDRVWTLLEKLVRAYGRSNPVCTSDPHLRPLFGDFRWPEIEKLLLSSRVITKESRATGGPKKDFLRRRVLPDDIMAGADRENEVPPQVRRLWDELERRFPIQTV